jgi:hypothetical protein
MLDSLQKSAKKVVVRLTDFPTAWSPSDRRARSGHPSRPSMSRRAQGEGRKGRHPLVASLSFAW